MLRVALIGWLASVAAATTALAAEYLEVVTSPVFEAAGDRSALTKRAALCLAQTGATNGAPETDLETGTTISGVLFPYCSAGVPWSVRSTLTIEAKDGRVRLTHTGLNHKQGGPAVSKGWSVFSGSVDQNDEGGWTRIGRWRFSGGDKAEAAAQAFSADIAKCIQAQPSDDW